MAHLLTTRFKDLPFSSNSQLLVGDDLAESVINSVSRPANRSCIKSSNAEFLLTGVAIGDGSSMLVVVTVEHSLRTLALKPSIPERRQAVVFFLKFIVVVSLWIRAILFYEYVLVLSCNKQSEFWRS